MAIWGDEEDAEQDAARRAEDALRSPRCERCQSEQVRELGPASSIVQWLACAECHHVWSRRTNADPKL